MEPRAVTYLTHAQISAAKSNDLGAVEAVIRETESLVRNLAVFYAGSSDKYGNELVEDLAQVGRVTVWESLSKFEGAAPGAFMLFIRKALHTAMSECRRRETSPGVSARAAKDFEEALTRASGDPYDAERIAASDAMGDRKMSPEHAYAARLSWLGLDYLDRSAANEGGEPLTLADKIERESGVPAELITPADIASHRRTMIRTQVHRVLGLLSERQRHVLKAGFGVSPVPQYRPGADDDELAADMGCTRYQVQQARTKGSRRFGELYRAGARAW
ncbi:hypothetical protein SLA_2173 [Streptomyces laurentii]|uniref:Uncharacterized protein n=1 Tax=Streptomyces laurentii TaxID=39478 RepID=A0A160NY92_STRLU|nr:hypothetical protein SLA_2173 [Streptomyces laurentii]